MPRQTLTVQLMHANARIAALEAELLGCQAANAQLHAEVASLHVAQRPSRPAPSTKPMPTEGQGYWDYVRAVKKWAYANNKPVSYMIQQDWANYLDDLRAYA